MRKVATFLSVSAFVLLAGCEGLFTGERDSKQPLAQADDGSFTAVKLTLNPDMNPIALNLHGETIAHPDESERWNSYRAALTLNGATVAGGTFTINNPGTRPDQPHGGPFRQTMLFASVPQAGEYELTIMLTQPKAITIQSPVLEIRRNTQPQPR
jgi:hypothetical protein